jgi:NAD(P)-dependent dehydrogenase (short-subunit alcohol dehydrogenase family)
VQRCQGRPGDGIGERTQPRGGARAELRGRGIAVLGAYPGGIDTDMLAGVEADKAAPELVATRIIAALAAGETVVFPDDASAGAGAVYRQDPLKLEQMLLAS